LLSAGLPLILNVVKPLCSFNTHYMDASQLAANRDYIAVIWLTFNTDCSDAGLCSFNSHYTDAIQVASNTAYIGMKWVAINTDCFTPLPVPSVFPIWTSPSLPPIKTILASTGLPLILTSDASLCSFNTHYTDASQLSSSADNIGVNGLLLILTVVTPLSVPLMFTIWPSPRLPPIQIILASTGLPLILTTLTPLCSGRVPDCL